MTQWRSEERPIMSSLRDLVRSTLSRLSTAQLSTVQLSAGIARGKDSTSLMNADALKLKTYNLQLTTYNLNVALPEVIKQNHCCCEGGLGVAFAFEDGV